MFGLTFFFEGMGRLFNKELVNRQVLDKYIIIPFGVVTLPFLIVAKIIYKRVLSRVLDFIWDGLCWLYYKFALFYELI